MCTCCCRILPTHTEVGFITSITSSSSSTTPHSMISSRAAVAYSPPIHSAISFHRGLGSCRHCFNTRGRDAAAVHLHSTPQQTCTHASWRVALSTNRRCTIPGTRWESYRESAAVVHSPSLRPPCACMRGRDAAAVHLSTCRA
jgi:hypothetical protein